MILLALAMFAETATNAQATEPVPPKPKLICKSFDVTGSLVSKQKVCRTAAAWNKAREDMQDEAHRLSPHVATDKGG